MAGLDSGLDVGTNFAAPDLDEVAASWAPEPVTTTGGTTAWSVAAFSGVLDLPPVAVEGEPLPPLWHWFGFLEHTRQDELGADGHPADGHFLPPMPHRRRMFAGGRLEVRSPMRVGETLERTTTLASSRAKDGRSGPMLLVTLRHEFRRGAGGGEVAVVEEQDFAYRVQPPGQARGIPAPTAPSDPPAPGAHAVELHPDDTLLFRVSALTYNTHRIHYDRSYATGVEGYPDLVVHGPLLALMLLEIPRRHRADEGLTRFEYRLERPAFAGSTLRAEPADEHRLVGGVPGAPPSITATITLAAQEDPR